MPEDGGPRVVDLVQADAWQPVQVADDPFASRRSAGSTCDPTAFLIEGEGASQVFEIETEICNYATVSQPSLEAVEAGDRVEIVLSHNTLTTRQSAEAFAVIRLGEQSLWSETVPIPSEAASYEVAGEATSDYPAGTPVTFHIDNHGTNSWRLFSVRAHRIAK